MVFTSLLRKTQRVPSWVVRAAIWGAYLGFLGLFLVLSHPDKGYDFLQHFRPTPSYAYPGWIAALLAPLGALPPEIAFAIFMLFSAALLAATALREGAVWLLVWPVSLYTLWVGNFTPWMLFGAALGYRWWRQGNQYSLALLPFALTLLKPHLILGFLLWLGIEVWRLRRWREAALVGGGLVGFAILTLASGVPGSDYWQQWFFQNGYSPLSILPVEIKVPLWGVGLALLGLWLWKRPSNEINFAAAWAWGVLLTPYFQVQDLLFFVPALVLLVNRDTRWSALILALGIAPWISVLLIPLLTSVASLGTLQLSLRHAMRPTPVSRS